MTIANIIHQLEKWAPLPYQESYDNAGLITGDADWQAAGILCTLDATEAVIDEAIARGCNLVVAHHPIVFSGLKKLTPRSYVERAVIKAIKNDIAIYAIHTNLDNVSSGVSRLMAERLQLQSQSLKVLAPKNHLISQLHTYVPHADAEKVRNALFQAGAGSIGQYTECSFNIAGQGTFKPQAGARPTIGQAGGPREQVEETKISVIFPSHLQNSILKTLFQSHPYETPAYELLRLENIHQETGSGMIGRLPHPMTETELLQHIKKAFGVPVIRHTPFTQKKVETLALCGGAGSFLTQTAISAGADAYLTADIKYHEFFDADGRLLLMDIGHWESEQFTIDGLANYLQHNFPTFAVLKTGVQTNPVHYYI